MRLCTWRQIELQGTAATPVDLQIHSMLAMHDIDLNFSSTWKSATEFIIDHHVIRPNAIHPPAAYAFNMDFRRLRDC
jgi:hypothetical protein